MPTSRRQIWGGHLSADPDRLMLEFCAGRDVAPLPMADAELLPFDLWTNRAHAIMLARQGILPAGVLGDLLGALTALEAEWEGGTFALDPACEDVHINVERYVSARVGAETGGRLHTARSRNDQVACDMRLYLRQRVLELGRALCGLERTLLAAAGEHADAVMPGFTHHQPAMITTWGHWLCGYAQALGRDLERVGHAFALVNRNPLGAAASFGTSWPIDRELTTELLAFARVEHNTLDCIAARGELEAQVAFTYAGVMNHLAVMAQDLILLSHPYWGLLTLPESYVTGSSIMPQKRNPDFAEVVKGKAAWVTGTLAGLLGVPRGNMSGYNRDTQITKVAVMDVIRECAPAPAVMGGAFAGLAVNRAAMSERLGQGYLAATDFADALARELGLPFRACYDIAADAVGRSGSAGVIGQEAAAAALRAAGHDPAPVAAILAELSDPARVVGWRRHTGSPAPEAVRQQVGTLSEALTAQEAFLEARQAEIDAAYRACRAYRAAP